MRGLPATGNSGKPDEPAKGQARGAWTSMPRRNGVPSRGRRVFSPAAARFRKVAHLALSPTRESGKMRGLAKAGSPIEAGAEPARRRKSNDWASTSRCGKDCRRRMERHGSRSGLFRIVSRDRRRIPHVNSPDRDFPTKRTGRVPVQLPRLGRRDARTSFMRAGSPARQDDV